MYVCVDLFISWTLSQSKIIQLQCCMLCYLFCAAIMFCKDKLENCGVAMALLDLSGITGNAGTHDRDCIQEVKLVFDTNVAH